MTKKRTPPGERRPVGRPRKLPLDLTERFMIRCSRADVESWQREADPLGITVGAWVRAAAKNFVGKIKVSP